MLLLRLKPRGDGGTDVRFSVELEPRVAALEPVVAVGFARGLHDGLDAALPQLMERLHAPELRFGPSCPVLGEAERQRIAAGCARLADRSFAASLESFLNTASTADTIHMSPLRLGPIWGLGADEAVRAFVDAVEAGVLAMRWEVLCPFCRGRRPLERAIRRVHCPACNIYFDSTFADAVEVSFGPADAIRVEASAPSCPGSPVWRPHCLVQERVQPGARVRLEQDLEPGICRLRAWPMRGAASVEVREGGPSTLTVEIGERGIRPLRATVGVGRVELVFLNTDSRPLDVALERRTLGDQVLTAGRVRELTGLPAGQALRSGRSAQRRGLVAAERTGIGRESLADRLRDLPARVVQADERRLVASFDDLDAALGSALALASSEDLSVGLGAGMVTELDEQLLGEAVEVVLGAAPLGWLPFPAIPLAQAGDPELGEALAARTLRLVPARSSEEVMRVREAFL
ncbi:MAG TPA: DUF5939 domain-containing protein [Myxococcota bacterium]|nr:DUF5939 domain-containing protein [Myxococcota bacterium]